VLTTGVERMRSTGKVTPTLASGMLSLAQILVESDEPAKALEVLEDKKFGPLMLVKEKSTAASAPGYAVETYKAALRSYVGTQKLPEAEATMKLLEGLVSKSKDAKASATLTQIYISLGRSLQKQLQALRKAGRTAEVASVSESFEKFLRVIVAREKGVTYNSLNWVAETFYNLGGGFDDPSGQLPEQAKRYYEQAAKGYQRILDSAEGNSKFLPSENALYGVRLRLASCMSKLGRHDEAINHVTDVLRDKPMMLPAQIIGAEIYRAQGPANKSGYARALQGGEPGGRDRANIIWGWNKIAKATLGKPTMDETWHLARYNMAECRFQYGLLEKNAELRKKLIGSAEQDLWYTFNLAPNMGGPEMAAKSEELLKKIQTELGKPPTGFEEFRNRKPLVLPKVAQVTAPAPAAGS